MNQAGCERCWSPEASRAWDALADIPIETRLIDESHYIVVIRKCPSCSQRYLQVTTETVDWISGEDPIFRTAIPIEEDEHDRLTSTVPLDCSVVEAIGQGRTSLRYDWPRGEEPTAYWSTGLHTGVLE